MVLNVNGELICDITVHPEPGGLRYAVVRPHGTSLIFGRRDYLLNDVARLVQAAAKRALERGPSA